MQTFKRILLSALGLLCCLAILSVIVIEPALKTEAAYYNDQRLRRELSGSIDFIALGASHGLAAFDPRILDEELGCCSYNLSGSMMTSYSKLYLLNKELARNPVKTVVLEIAFDSFARDEAKEYAIGDAVTVERLDSVPERIAFMLRYVGLEDWMNVYSRGLAQGITGWKRILTGRADSCVDAAAKGFLAKDPADLSLTPEQAAKRYAGREISSHRFQKTVDRLGEMIRVCREKDAKVIVCVTPLPDSTLWERSGWDDFRVWLKDYCEQTGCPCYDFNLLKARYELFSDTESFYDDGHMSAAGAAAFSRAFAQLLRRAEQGEDVSALFYASYDEMLRDSPYAPYLP